MGDIETEVIKRDQNSLARNLKLKVAGKTVFTPSRVLGSTRTSIGDLELLSYDEFKSLTVFAEVYSAITMEKVEACLEDNGERLEFETEIDRALRKAIEAGQLPYLMIAVQDNRRDPIGKLPPDAELNYILNLLWRPTNPLIVVPLFGELRSEKEYQTLASMTKSRLDSIGSKPVVATIPSVYRSLTKTVVDTYWKAGIRSFALDLEGRSMGAQGTVITLVNITLNSLSRRDKEPYLLMALNTKDHVGTGEYARLHNLLGHAYGFDVVGINRVRRKGWSGTTPRRTDILDSIRFFQANDYGYLNIGEMRKLEKGGQRAELNTPPVESLSIESLRRMEPDFVRKCARLHNAVKDQREELQFRKRIEGGTFDQYLERKRRIRSDLPGVWRVASMAKKQTQM